MTTNEYLAKINRRYLAGISREHSYRADLESLIENIVPHIDVTNEPANVTDCGNPDYVITKGKIPIGYIEAKDIGKDLKSKQYKEQFSRYRKALDNLIITDYIWFQFFQNGELVHEIKIGEIENGAINPLSDNFSQFENLVQNFCSFVGQTIKSSKKLAEMMAAKARLLQDILERAINSDEETQENSSLKGQFDTFKQILIHDLKAKEFADIYAQTLAYGMFAARLHDTSLDNFSRQEAAELIPKSNPFLRKLFGYVAGPDIDERIRRTVDNLAEVFRATNVDELLKNFGNSTQTNDPIIHFYETFLAEYDPKLRKSRGVWYTPEPVVNFIVRAVDDILKTEFGLPQGLADTTKTTIEVNTQMQDKRSKTGYKREKREIHKVQILDPATGTGTFLAEVVKHIYNHNFKNMQGAWSGYVEEHLIPRLNGFELLMASYAMAHLKLDMLLRETGFHSKKDQRFNIFLTNSLEEHHPDTGTLFANWLSSEANEANHIKRDTPVMCVIGNPPYSGISSNNGKWISDLIDDYKYVDGEHINERKHWLNDDYVKFIRFGQHFIEKNGEGVLAFINPHGFLDNPTFRGMRWNLLKTYDKIYAINLHGNTKRNEKTPDGLQDVNVFDIQQGVSINIFIKLKGERTIKDGHVLYYDCWGSRQEKYAFLLENDLSSINFEKITPEKPYNFFVPKDDTSSEVYFTGFNIVDVFNLNSVGIQTSRDKLVIDFKKEDLLNRIEKFSDASKTNEEIRNEFFSYKKSGKYKLGDTRGWKVDNARVSLNKMNLNECIVKCSYRPFDKRFLFYSEAMVDWTRINVMRHLLTSTNLCLLIPRQLAEDNYYHSFISDSIAEMCVISNKTKEQNAVFPLYLYPETDGQQSLEVQSRTPNLNPEIVAEIAKKLNLTFTPEKEGEGNLCFANNADLRPEFRTSFAPIDLLDYIYAVLHSPAYREKYKEFLKIDFPRVPYPKDQESFWALVALGGELRQVHLLESPKVSQFITSYPESGDNTITRKLSKTSPGFELTDEKMQLGKVWINDEQYFDKVPLAAWAFYIGGYQPAQKWLKDRKGRTLSFEDLLHYQKIIVALTETGRLMQEIEQVNFL